jgi:hypothetical protein
MAIATFGPGSQTGIPISGSFGGGSGTALQNGSTPSNASSATPNLFGVNIPNPEVLGASTNQGVQAGGGGGGGLSLAAQYAQQYAPQIGSIDAQTGLLRSTLEGADTQLNQGLSNLQNQYQFQKTSATTNHNNAVTDFNNTEQNDNLNHGQAIDQVGTKARTLANSVRQMIGNASGSGSSAYQIAAPGAVQRQADLQSQDINNNFGQNMHALATSRQLEDQAYEGDTGILAQLQDKLVQGQNGLRTGIEGQKQQINGQLADLAAQRAAYLGGNAQAAAAPYQANIAQEQQAIKDIAANYQSPFANVQPVAVAAPTLRDYITGGTTNVATNPGGTQTTNTPTFNPLASWLNKDQQNQYSF